MKKGVLWTVVLLLCFGMLAGVSRSADKVVTLEFSGFQAATDPNSLILQEWCDQVAKRTNGRVRVNYHPGSTLTPISQTFDSVVNELVDIGNIIPASTPGRFPLMEVMDLPLGVKTAVTGARLVRDVITKFKPKEFASVKFLIMTATPPIPLTTKKPVRNLEDLQGMKIRAIGGASLKVVQFLGAVPVMIPTGELYDALSKGVMDGLFCPAFALETLKIGEIAKYTTLNYRSSYMQTNHTVMNLKKWNSLPPDVQKIIEIVSEEYSEKANKLLDSLSEEVIVSQKAKGHTFITLSPEEEKKWATKVAPLFDEWVKDKSAKGLPGAEVLKFCLDWVEKNQK